MEGNKSIGAGAAPEEDSLEQAFMRLEFLCNKLESKDTSLEQAFSLYQEGVMLLRSCGKRLDLVEKQMLQLNEDGSIEEFRR